MSQNTKKLITPLAIIILLSVISPAAFAYFTVNQYFTLQNNAFILNPLNVFAIIAAPVSNVITSEVGINPHYNGPTSLIDIETGINYTNLADTCDTSTQEVVEYFTSPNGEVTVQTQNSIILQNAAAVVKYPCPYGTCINGLCPCGPETSTALLFPLQISPYAFSYAESIAVDNTFYAFSVGGTQKAILLHDTATSTTSIVSGSISANLKQELEIAAPNLIYLEQPGSFPNSVPKGLYVYHIPTGILRHIRTLTQYTNLTIQELNADIDETGRYVVWQGLIDYGNQNTSSNIYLMDAGPDTQFGTLDDIGPIQLTSGSASLPRITKRSQTQIEVQYIISSQNGGLYTGPTYLERASLLETTTGPTVTSVQPVDLGNGGEIFDHDIWQVKSVIATQTGNQRTTYIKNYMVSTPNTVGQFILQTNNAVSVEKFDDNYVILLEIINNNLNLRAFNVITNLLSSPGNDNSISLAQGSDYADIEFDASLGGTVIYYTKDTPNSQIFTSYLMSNC